MLDVDMSASEGYGGVVIVAAAAAAAFASASLKRETRALRRLCSSVAGLDIIDMTHPPLTSFTSPLLTGRLPIFTSAAATRDPVVGYCLFIAGGDFSDRNFYEYRCTDLCRGTIRRSTRMD
mmetsp:Transcript_10682/g.23938  ORF Transcript_10682/g.23938 Transcript_10682/m.23938 type:complete len:121 (-) Transcript_10682:93-455(-)